MGREGGGGGGQEREEEKLHFVKIHEKKKEKKVGICPPPKKKQQQQQQQQQQKTPIPQDLSIIEYKTSNCHTVIALGKNIENSDPGSKPTQTRSDMWIGFSVPSRLRGLFP